MYSTVHNTHIIKFDFRCFSIPKKLQTVIFIRWFLCALFIHSCCTYNNLNKTNQKEKERERTQKLLKTQMKICSSVWMVVVIIDLHVVRLNENSKMWFYFMQCDIKRHANTQQEFSTRCFSPVRIQTSLSSMNRLSLCVFFFQMIKPFVMVDAWFFMLSQIF